MISAVYSAYTLTVSTLLKFPDLTCVVHQESSPQNVAFIWAYIFEHSLYP